jgi:hypothetical protein
MHNFRVRAKDIQYCCSKWIRFILPRRRRPARDNGDANCSNI